MRKQPTPQPNRGDPLTRAKSIADACAEVPTDQLEPGMVARLLRENGELKAQVSLLKEAMLVFVNEFGDGHCECDSAFFARRAEEEGLSHNVCDYCFARKVMGITGVEIVKSELDIEDEGSETYRLRNLASAVVAWGENDEGPHGDTKLRKALEIYTEGTYTVHDHATNQNPRRDRDPGANHRRSSKRGVGRARVAGFRIAQL